MKLYMGMLGNNLINNGIKLFKNMNKSFFITGTDTHIGKTEITCGLIQFFQERGYLACGMKPVAAGTEIIDGTFTGVTTGDTPLGCTGHPICD